MKTEFKSYINPDKKIIVTYEVDEDGFMDLDKPVYIKEKKWGGKRKK